MTGPFLLTHLQVTQIVLMRVNGRVIDLVLRVLTRRKLIPFLRLKFIRERLKLFSHLTLALKVAVSGLDLASDFAAQIII